MGRGVQSCEFALSHFLPLMKTLRTRLTEKSVSHRYCQWETNLPFRFQIRRFALALEIQVSNKILGLQNVCFLNSKRQKFPFRIENSSAKRNSKIGRVWVPRRTYLRTFTGLTSAARIDLHINVDTPRRNDEMGFGMFTLTIPGFHIRMYRMTNQNMGSDNWGQLLSDFGIEDQTPAEVTPPETPKVSEPSGMPERSPKGTRALPESAPSAEIPGESSAPKEKKSIFSRFPKMNFFGAPPEVSLDSVIEGVKSPSLGGKAFTDNKMEKMPISQERTDRQKKNRRESEPVDEPADESNAWSAVASQINALASGGDLKPKTEKRPAKRSVSSMFDDPVPESEESRALKNLMGEQPNRRGSRRDAFLEEESGSRQREERGRRKPQSEEREEFRGRGSRYRPPVEVDDLPESDFEPVEDETPRTQGRGRRGSRYPEKNYRDREPIRDEAPQEEWSEVDAALQAGRNDFPQQGERGGRRQRYDKRRGSGRMEESRMDREPLSDDEDSGVVAVHGNIPSWDDAIGGIIMDNISKHRGHSGRSRR